MTRFVVLAEGLFGPHSSKTASACIRYTPERVASVIDSTRAGSTAQQVLGFGGDIPVVASLEEGLAYEPTALLIGIAPAGGALPEAWRGVIRGSIERGLDVWSGLHFFIGDDPEFAALAAARGVTIRDLRKPPADLVIAAGRVRDVAATVLLTVGTDCNIGKMTAALQLRDHLRSRGRRVAFAGTGQTGILIEGRGISVDAVIADFIAGATERLVLEAAADADIVLVEGQGSIIHPSYSGVTLGLMHGSMPHAMIMCGQPSRRRVRNHEWLPIPPYPQFNRLHEQLVEHLRPAPVIAITLNTSDLGEREALDAIARTSDETGLPCTDPVRFDPTAVTEAIDVFHRARTRAASESAAAGV
jgi:uncharacterized NAD-dependent epimerase/dehydratase family protein